MEQWQRALVTGASSGIGEALVGHLAAAGVDVVLVGRDRVALERVASGARAMGVDAVVLAADLALDADVARVVSVLRDSQPMIGLLVNNAGLGQYGSFVDLPLAGAVELMRVNNEALVQLTHAALVRMVAAGHGCVIQGPGGGDYFVYHALDRAGRHRRELHDRPAGLHAHSVFRANRSPGGYP